MMVSRLFTFCQSPILKGAIDSRIVLVADTEATEVIDVVAQKPVYRYANTGSMSAVITILLR